jgi:hypothetical protein
LPCGTISQAKDSCQCRVLTLGLGAYIICAIIQVLLLLLYNPV